MWGRILLILLLSASCQKKADSYREPVEDELEIVQRKIDKGQYDEAMADIDRILESEPENPRVIIVKSSIYTARAGIRISDYINMVEIVDPMPSEFSVAKPDRESLQKLLSELKRRLELIPVLQNETYDLIKKAVEVADTARLKTKGQGLYRVLIRTILIKSMWESGELYPDSVGKICASSNRQLQNQIQSTHEVLLAWMWDWTIILPERTEEILKARQDLRSVSFEASHWLSRNPDLRRSDLCKL